MSIKAPKPRQIRLPFQVPRPNKGQAPKKRVCGICRKNEADYTCPRCNAAYCSLACFKSQAHAQCSEPFYKETIVAEIGADPGVNQDEKRAMLEMLRRFEEGAGELEALDGMGSTAFLDDNDEDDRDEDEDELAKALDGVDLDELDSNALLRLLPPSHRDAFLAAIRDPDSDAGRELLAAAAADEPPETDTDMPDALPWWERSELAAEDETSEGILYAERPALLDAQVEGLVPPEGTGLKLAYNALAIALAYIHILLSFRLPSLDTTYVDTRRDEVKVKLGRIVPFLVDPKSTTRYTSARDAWAGIWEAIGQTLEPKPETDTLLRLLTILKPLLHPQLDTTQSHGVLVVLSDLWKMWAIPKAGAAVPRKLAFYFAALTQLGRTEWLRLENEVESEARRLEEEGREDVQDDRSSVRIS